MKYTSVEIYRDNNPDAARTIRISLHNGMVNLEEQDVGPLVERFFGDSDSERFLSEISIHAVKRVLSVDSDAALIDKLKELFGKNSGYNDFAAFLDKHGIHYKRWIYY